MPGNDSGLALTLKHSDRATDCQYADPRVGQLLLQLSLPDSQTCEKTHEILLQ